MPNDVVITGLGPVTSIGTGNDGLWASLMGGRANVAVRDLPVDVGRTIALPVASMPPDDQVPTLDTHLGFLADQECEGYRDLAYALLAIQLALVDAGLSYDRDRNTIGVIQAFEAPGVERTVATLFQMMSMPLPPGGPPPVYDLLAPKFYNMQAFSYVHLINKAFGFHGYATSVHNACSSGAFAIDAAAQRIRAGQAEVMIVVGAEAFDTGVRLEWFRRLDLYARDGVMRPFDAEPSGFFVGEGAAAIVLESAGHAAKRGAKVYAGYAGGAFAHQGWKQTIPDIRSARLTNVIQEALDLTATSAASVDLVIPHGASTSLSDGYEAGCLASALRGIPRSEWRVTNSGWSGDRGESAKTGNRQPAVDNESPVATAFKPYVGHMLAASGLIDTLCGLLVMDRGTILPTLHTPPDRVRLPVPLATKPFERRVGRLLKLFTGFTGHDAALVFVGK